MLSFRKFVVGLVAAALASFAVTASPASAAAGDITTFSDPLLDVDLVPITTGPDGNLWFGNNGPQNKSIGKITPGGTVSTFALSGAVRGIVAGPDGNIWFSHTDADRIGMVTPAGVITTFGDPNVNGPLGIVVGPDGNLWFVSFESDRIGTITTAGVITTFVDPLGQVLRPADITAGPDGNLWFTSQNNNRIGKITTAGVITTYTDPLGNINSPTGITTGSDGNLWFINYPNDRIGKITTAGLVTTYTDPPGGIDGPADITAGPDGNLWFTSNLNDRIGSITTAGVVTTFTDPEGEVDGPVGITAGPDGNLWFTSAGNRRIGFIEPPDFQPDELLERERLGNDVYNSDGTGQTRFQNAKRNRGATWWVYVQNDGDVPDDITVKGTGSIPGPNGFAVAYQYVITPQGTYPYTWITAQVVNGTFTIPDVPPGGEAKIVLHVKVYKNVQLGTVGTFFVTSTSQGAPTKSDTVKAVLTVV